MGKGRLPFVYPRQQRTLIQYIEVHQAEKVNGVWEQHLTIHYHCIGAIDIPDALQITMPKVTMNTRKGVYVSYVPNGQTAQVGV